MQEVCNHSDISEGITAIGIGRKGQHVHSQSRRIDEHFFVSTLVCLLCFLLSLCMGFVVLGIFLKKKVALSLYKAWTAIDRELRLIWLLRTWLLTRWQVTSPTCFRSGSFLWFRKESGLTDKILVSAEYL